MNTTDLAAQVAEQDSKITKTQAKAIVDAVLASIASAAQKAEEVSLPGFGKFKVQNKPAAPAATLRPARPSRSPPRRSWVFQPAKALKDALAK